MRAPSLACVSSATALAQQSYQVFKKRSKHLRVKGQGIFKRFTSKVAANCATRENSFLRSEQAIHSKTREIFWRRYARQTPHDVELNRILVFRCKADEGHADADCSLFANDTCNHVERCANFGDLVKDVLPICFS